MVMGVSFSLDRSPVCVCVCVMIVIGLHDCRTLLPPVLLDVIQCHVLAHLVNSI